jgi:hypothetical protein
VAITAPLLHRHRGGHGLQLALALEVELPAGQVVDEQQVPDLRDQRAAGEVRGARRQVEVDLVEIAERQPAGDRDALAVGLPVAVVRELEAVAEDVADWS